MKREVGIIQSNSEYHSNPAIGSTTLKQYMDNAVKAYKNWKGEIEQKKSDALKFGSLVHCLALEPDTFDDEFIVVDEGYREPDSERMDEIHSKRVNNELDLYPKEVLTPTGNLSSSAKAKAVICDLQDDNPNLMFITQKEMEQYERWLEVGDKTPVTQDMVDEAKVIADKALAYEFQMTTSEGVFRFTLQDAINHESAIMERAFYAWYNPETGDVTKDKMTDDSIELKTKPDILLDVGNGAYVVIDLKTSVDASPQSFRKGGNLFYHLQEAHYTKVLEANGLMIYKFKFLFVGKEEWSTAQDYEFDIPSKELGEKQFYKALKQHELALKGEVRETVFDGQKYDREPVIGLPNYLFYLD